MLRKLNLLIASLLLGVTLLAPALVPATAVAQAPAPTPPTTTQTDAKNKICEGIGGCGTVSGERGVNDVVKLVVNILSAIVAIAAVLAIIFAGFRYVIAMGDSSKISSAKDTILYAIIGLIVAGMAQVIVRFVLGKI